MCVIIVLLRDKLIHIRVEIIMYWNERDIMLTGQMYQHYLVTNNVYIFVILVDKNNFIVIIIIILC